MKYYVDINEHGYVNYYCSELYPVDGKILVEGDGHFPVDYEKYQIINISETKDQKTGELYGDVQRIAEVDNLRAENELLKQRITQQDERMDMTETALLEIGDAVLNFKGGE